MSSKNPAQRLRDIIDNIDAIRPFTADMNLSNFAGDRKTVYLPDDLKLRHSGIDWTAIAAAGNLYRHEYDVVDEALVWYTVQHSLTDLHDASTAELRRLTAPES